MKVRLKYLIPNLVTFTRLLLTIIFIIYLKSELILDRQIPFINQLAVIFLIVCLTDFIFYGLPFIVFSMNKVFGYKSIHITLLLVSVASIASVVSSIQYHTHIMEENYE